MATTEALAQGESRQLTCTPAPAPDAQRLYSTGQPERIVMRRINPAWFLISLASICVAFVLVRQDAPLSNDGVHYLHLAKNLHDGQFKDTVFPPGFPAAIALVAQTGMSFELSARIVMFISAAVLPILFALAFRPSIGSRAAVLSGFCWLAFP